MPDLVVVGGGLAGLTAGLFAARQGLETLVLEPAVPGGQTVNLDKIDDFPGFLDGVAGFDLGPTVQEQAANAGAQFAMGEAEALQPEGGGWVVAAGGERYASRAVVLATGSRPRPLGVPGEAALVGHGVSHCATCDGPLFGGRVVGVVGGGSSAFHEALTLVGFAARVLILAEEVTAQAVYRKRAEDEQRIEVREGVRVVEVVGDGTVSGVKLAGGEMVQLDGLFVYVGSDPNAALVAPLLELDAEGRVPTDRWLRTKLPGLLAAGDVRADRVGFALTAAADGATAAVAAHRYITTGEWT
ncbi:MAG TPA: FAD-dependent oxidoreductase [Chloroflexota bacterium]|nr:FAD-dependent oxidoreductase [Chloroflexota bacterium]